MNRLGFVGSLALALASPLGATAQVDPMGLIATPPRPKPAVQAAAPAPSAGPYHPANCHRNAAGYMRPVGPRPDSYQPAVLWPDADPCVPDFGELKFTAAKAMKKAFDDASRTPCSDCEGGWNYESWANYYTEKDGSKSKFEAKLLALPIGKSITWTARKFKGQVTLTGAHPIGDYPCKQFHWTLTAAGKVAAEREGLYCEVAGRWREVV